MTNKKHIPFEDQLFEYEAQYLVTANGDTEFEDVTLKVAIGNQPVGSKFAEAFLSSAGILGLRNADGTGEAYYLNISIGDRVEMSEITESAHCHDRCCN